MASGEETDDESSEKSSGGHSQVFCIHVRKDKKKNNGNKEGRLITDRGEKCLSMRTAKQ